MIHKWFLDPAGAAAARLAHRGCFGAGEGSAARAARRRPAAGDGWAGRPTTGCGRPQYACSCATLEEADYQLLAAEVEAGRCEPASHASGQSPALWLCGQAAVEPALYSDLAARNCTKTAAPCRYAGLLTLLPNFLCGQPRL